MKTSVLLISEKDGRLCRDLKKHLIQNRIAIFTLQTQSASLQLFQTRRPDLVIVCTYVKSARDELRIIRQIRRQEKQVPIILIAKYSSEALAIAALKIGVNDFFILPISLKELMRSIQESLLDSCPSSHAKRKRTPSCSHLSPNMVGDSGSMQEVKAHLLKVAKTDSTVLITGETGTGKELATEAIHCNSPRSKKPLVCINCAAIPDSLVENELFGHERGAFTGAVGAKRGLLEEAASGTVFFDEIGDMTPFAQAKILRAIELKRLNRLGGKGGKHLDFRVIAATNREPEKLVAKSKFRKDLYYRLNVARVHMPPLRDRKEDIPYLVDYYVGKFNKLFGRSTIGFTESATNAMLCYNWPGNVRELKNIIEASFINLPNQEVDYIDLPEKLHSRIKTLKALPESERDRLILALQTTKWNKSRAAQKLNWSRMTVYRKMAKYHISKSPVH